MMRLSHAGAGPGGRDRRKRAGLHWRRRRRVKLAPLLRRHRIVSIVRRTPLAFLIGLKIQEIGLVSAAERHRLRDLLSHVRHYADTA